MRTEATVTKYSINPEVPASMFDEPAYADGTIVRETILMDGKSRTITRGIRGEK